MPVDLSPAGRASAYPPRMRFWPWGATWFVCNVCGPAIVLLAWPKGERASGLGFWSLMVGAPNGLFLVLFGFARAGYEVLWYRAHWRNHHRERWLAEQVRLAQRPLHVLDAGYCLPLAGKSLTDVLSGKQSLLKIQSTRHGPGKVLCNRFEDDDPLLASLPVVAEEDSEGDDAGALTEVAPAVRMIRVAIEPLAGSIQALTRYEKRYWPQVRVLAEPETACLRVAQVREALRLAALPPLEIQSVAATDGLLVADGWLDARERRPLLAVAAAGTTMPLMRAVLKVVPPYCSIPATSGSRRKSAARLRCTGPSRQPKARLNTASRMPRSGVPSGLRRWHARGSPVRCSTATVPWLPRALRPHRRTPHSTGSIALSATWARQMVFSPLLLPSRSTLRTAPR